MYEVVGENAIIKQEKKIRVSKVPVDLKWHERLFFGDYVRVNKNLVRRVPNFYENDVYLPRMFAPRAEELELLQDGGRSCINLDKHANLDLFGVRQTYIEKRKGVGANGYKTELGFKLEDGGLENRKLRRYLEDSDLLFLDTNEYGFDRPYGSQRKGLALNELEKSQLLERLGVKHTPVLCVYPIPKHAEKKAKELTDRHFWHKDRPKETRYYQEVILFPGNIRVPTATNEYDIYIGNLKRLGVNLNEFSKELEKDFLHFMEMVPKTLTKTGDEITKMGGEYTVLGFSNWGFGDCVLAPTGLYVSDLESVSFYRMKKTDLISGLISDMSIFYYFNNFLNMMEKMAYRHLPEKNNDEIVEGLIDTLNTGKYFDVELKGKEQDGEVDRYLLNFKMDCESGICVDLNEYVSLYSRQGGVKKPETAAG